MKVKIISWNVRGVNDLGKRKSSGLKGLIWFVCNTGDE